MLLGSRKTKNQRKDSVIHLDLKIFVHSVAILTAKRRLDQIVLVSGLLVIMLITVRNTVSHL